MNSIISTLPPVVPSPDLIDVGEDIDSCISPPPAPPPPTSSPTPHPNTPSVVISIPTSTKGVYTHPNYPRTYLDPFTFKYLPTPLPSTLNCTVLHISSVTYNGSRELRFLEKVGVSVGCEVDFIEVDISPILRGKGLKNWRKDMKGREKDRDRVRRIDEKDRVRRERRGLGREYINRTDEYLGGTTEVENIQEAEFIKLADIPKVKDVQKESEETWRRNKVGGVKVMDEGNFPSLGGVEGGGEKTNIGGVKGAWGGDKGKTKEEETTELFGVKFIKRGGEGKKKKGKLKYKPLIL
jgi:hypothetical protein